MVSFGFGFGVEAGLNLVLVGGMGIVVVLILGFLFTACCVDVCFWYLASVIVFGVGRLSWILGVGVDIIQVG